MDNSTTKFENGMFDQEQKNDTEKERQKRVAEILILIEKIKESGEILPFPGINEEAYLKLKKADDEYPGFTTPTDEIIERCKKEGIKLIVGKNPGSGNIFVLPAKSDNIQMDSIDIHQLEIGNVKNIHLAEIIRLKTKTK